MAMHAPITGALTRAPFSREPIIELPQALAYIVGAPAAPRSAVEAIIEKAIAALDELDGDPDIEQTDAEDDFVLSYWARQSAAGQPGCSIADCDSSVEDDPKGFDPEEDMCLAGDDGCGFHRAGGLSGWGADYEGGIFVPRYGIDQSKGPTNQREASLAWDREMLR